MSLATKYRPRTFADMTEQSLVVDIVKKMCEDTEHINRNFLFIGPAGTGKTTIARIIANNLNNNVGEPIEIDAASNSGVEHMRNIVKEAQQYPVIGVYKIFIIDECHAISSTGWQALLKVLEECPAKTIMIFCTTNPEKIPATILSRVQTFQLSKISLAGITSRIKYVLDCEINEGRAIKYDENAISFLAKLANGGMRDALTLTDKALTYSDEITLNNLEIALNLPNYDDYFLLLQAYAAKDNTKLSQIINDVYNSGVNFIKWFEGFHSFVINVVKYIFLQDIEQTMIPGHYKDKIAKYGTAHSIICLKLANKLLVMNNELKSTQYLQEVALTHLCQIPKKEH